MLATRDSSVSVSVSSSVPRVPAWAALAGGAGSEREAAFMAGGALNAIDTLVRSEAAWLGAWRYRLALKAATASARLAGHREDEAALRDAWLLRQPGDAPGPAGETLAAWRRLVGRSHPPDGEELRKIADLLGVGLAEGFDPMDRLREEADAPAPLAAAHIAAAVVDANPKAEILAWWLADCALSWRMGWRHAAPVLATQIHASALRMGPERRRPRPGTEAFAHAMFVAAALGAGEACRMAAGMAARAERLHAVAPKLRSKSAGEVIDRLFCDDAVSGTLTTKTLSRWASRRLFERLTQLGAVRELSGRPSFRIYGL